MRLQRIGAWLARALLAFSVVIGWLLPAATVGVAQTAPPTVTLSPAAPNIPVGGTITVSGTGFHCDASIAIDLMDSTGYHFLVHLGNADFESSRVCGDFFNNQFTLPPSAVGPGQYRVRASDDFGNSAVSQGAAGLITVGVGVSILGTASCASGDGSTPLPGATVQLSSGDALVATTQASKDLLTPTYTFSGAQPNATYQVRYTQANSDGPAISCGSVVAPNSDGGQVPATSFCPNEAWDIAPEILSGQSAAVNTDTICKPNQSIWRRIAIAPGQQTTVTVLNASGKTRVALFKDLRADFRTLLAGPTNVATAQQMDASMSGKASAPWDSSPWDSSPWDSSPWDSSPWDSSPWDSSPWDSSPWDSSPWDSSALCADAGVSTSQAASCAGAYSTVQMRDLLAFSSNGQITRNTWDTTGFYYIRVFNQDATFDPTQKLTVLASVVGTCGVPPGAGTAPILKSVASSHLTGPGSTNLPGGATTLIITNTQRLRDSTGAPITSNTVVNGNFQTAVNAFSGLTMKNGQQVKGLLVDLANDSGLQQDYAQWDTPPLPSCPAAANIISSAIHDLINAYRAQSPGLKYVTILGGHTVVPYRLTPDHAELELENRYNPGLLDLSESAGSLGNSYVMNDSYYVSLNPASRLESEVALPDPGLAVGRLVEFAEDITNNLDAFNANLGVMRPTAALATGYTFVADLATDELNLFQQGGVTDTDKLINDTWTAPDLKGKLFDPARDGLTGPNFDILALNWHARSNEAVAADYSTTHPTVVESSDIANWTADQRFSNVLVLSIGCHLAYPLINGDVIPNPTSPPPFVTDAGAFTESFLNKGAMVLGNTGYGYGDTDFEGYSEHLLSLVTQGLESGTAGDGGVPVGIALSNAKRDYILSSAALTGVDKKAVEELTFYGPPMWSVDFASRIAAPTSNQLPISPQTANDATKLSAAKVVPQYTLTQRSTKSDPATTFFEADGGKQEMPFRADLPYKSFDVSRPANGVARGVALIAADYTDAANTTSTVSLPATELSGTRPGWVTHGFWPFQTYGLNLLAGQALFVTPIQWLSTSGTSGTTRSYPDASKTNLRVFYSNASDGSVLAGPASIDDVNVSTTGTSSSLVHVDVTVNGSPISDVYDVLVSYTGTGPSSPFYGHWQTCSLIANRADTDTTSRSCSSNVSTLPIQTQPFSFVRHYAGDIDAGSAANANDLHLVVQVVSNTGLVSVRNNNGQYFSAETATIANPKSTSTVKIVDPIATPVTYDRPVTFVANITSDKSATCVAGRPVTFHLGSQSKTVAADGSGNATATFTVLSIPTSIDGHTPANYPLSVTVAETPDCLAGFASDATQVSVQKKNTRLAFVNSNPYLAKLVDADNVALRDEFVFFTVKNGTGTVVTRSAQTDGNGIAQLRDLQLPSGAYTVTVSFPGTIPTPGGTIKLTDERYNRATPISTRLTADVTPPTCTIVGVFTNPAGQKYVKITVQDTGSGLAAVNPIEQVNLLPLQISAYSAGVKTVVTVIATKLDQSQSSQIGLEVVDVAGNVTSCDPILAEVGRDGPGGVPRSESFNHLAHGESSVTIINDKPGLDRVVLTVNGKRFQVRDLDDGETRRVDVASAMRKDANNKITITAQGKAGGTAVVMITDAP